MCVYVCVCASLRNLLCVCNTFYSFVSGAYSKCPFGGDAGKAKPAESGAAAGAADDSEDSESEKSTSDPESEVELDMEGKSGAINTGEKKITCSCPTSKFILTFTRRH